MTKKELNRVLYRLKEVGLVDRTGQPPRWHRVPTAAKDEEKNTSGVHIVIDLSNSPNEWPAAVEALKSHTIASLTGYADVATDTRKLALPENIRKTQDGFKNSADTKLVWDIAQLSCVTQTKLAFIIVTKDMGFRSLETLLKQAKHTCDFVTYWSDALLLLKDKC
jgi:hypothetical protein